VAQISEISVAYFSAKDGTTKFVGAARTAAEMGQILSQEFADLNAAQFEGVFYFKIGEQITPYLGPRSDFPAYIQHLFTINSIR
jgi:hypothetical protein